MIGGSGAKVAVSRQDRSPGFPDARLKILSPGEGETLEDGNVSVTLELSGFETGVQTKTGREKELANSGDGQHVHIIVDNGPYMACYDTSKPFPVGELSEGTHVLRAFPSRSYHESVKTDGSFAMVTFHVKKATGAPVKAGEPLLTYSRPKGEYAGAGAKKIMVDFHLQNVELSADGHSVRLTVDGQEEILTEWTPYFVEGLAKGERIFKLELIDKDGNPVPGAYNSTERSITVKSAN